MKQIKQLTRHYWQISQEYSRAYLIAQVMVFFAAAMEMLSGLVVLGTGDTLSENMNFIAKGLMESVTFLILSHYVLRGFLKTQVVPFNFNFERGVGLVGFLILLACIHVLINMGLDASELLGFPSTENISVTIDGKENVLNIHSPVLWSLAVLNRFSFFLVWSLAYIFWHAALSKRELQKKMETVRFQQLTNQLNPHFLFNTLNSIRALIFEDREKAADLVTKLSELFRTHLQAHLTPVASLEEECRIAQQYLSIEKVRVEERMQVSFDIDDTVLQQKLPTLTLLTLIENAVKHGISPNPEQGYIKVQACRLNQQTWQLEITNSFARQSSSTSTGTGLKNTKQRLQLMFADQARLDVQENSQSWDKQNQFSVVMELPYV